MFLTELPIVGLLVLAICFNSSAGGQLKLYPLITVLSLAIILIFIFLFRVIVISAEEIRAIGPFSSKDKAIINKDKTLILTLRDRGRLIVTLFGNDGERPALDWARGDDYIPVDINLFRERVEGRVGSAKKILRYFGIPSSDISAIVSGDCFTAQYDGFTVSAEEENSTLQIKIKFNETL